MTVKSEEQSRAPAPLHITLRPALPADEAFLLELYAGTRAEELASIPWNEAQREAFVRMQFAAQHRSYEAQYPAADHQIIMLDEQPVGRIMVFRAESETHLVNISLLRGKLLLEEGLTLGVVPGYELHLVGACAGVNLVQ